MSLILSFSYTNALQSLDLGEMVDKQHERIVLAIEARDSARARQAMEDHIASVLEVCQDLGL